MKYADQIYAGVLGKLIGVYLGRPVEGWSYEKIIEEFGEIEYYIHEQVGVPLIVSDDDISGTFGFFKALRDYGFQKEITAEDFGNTWLNYIIEDKTILWWGGLGRSTEHTAYLNLKKGIKAPESGAIATNGQTLAEQIGAQIFIDAIAFACPNDPDRAVDLVRKAASVSHDGLAVDAACHLAAMEAMAFEERDLNKLLDRAFVYIKDERLQAIVTEVRRICEEEDDWRIVRNRLNEAYGYHIWPGCCHMVPNHAMVIASLIMGGDDFQKSIQIAASAAWDTDCNAGNVGALNGVRLGIDGINAGADFRRPVADRMYVVTSDGGSVVSDAVLEAREIIRAAGALTGEEVETGEKRYAFEFPGSVQGFTECPEKKESFSQCAVGNYNENGPESGLEVRCRKLAPGTPVYVSTPVFIDFANISNNFGVTASPTLYSTQTVCTALYKTGAEEVSARLYILYYDLDNQIQYIEQEEAAVLAETVQVVTWKIPDTGGMPVFRLGYKLESESRYDGSVVIRDIDWNGAPECFAQEGMLMTSIWNTNPRWLSSFAASAKHFAADFKYTYCISHPEKQGVVTIGTDGWTDYSVASTLYFSMHVCGGLVIRSRGHRRYYGAVLQGYEEAVIFMQKDGVRTVLKSVPYVYKEDTGYACEFSAEGERLYLCINGELVAETEDSQYVCGSGGFLIEEGTMTAEDFYVKRK